jgi:flagellar biosynthesis protein FlhF
MIVRRYTGPSQEKLCDSVKKELGTNAVIVHSGEVRGKRGLLAGRQFEMIAVVDDAEADRHRSSQTATPADVAALAGLYQDTFQKLHQDLDSLRHEVQHVCSASAPFNMLPADETPPAAPWHPAFLRDVIGQDRQILGDPDRLRNAVRDRLNVAPGLPSKPDSGPHVVALIGPTGAGKTTTLAKLAATWTIESQLAVGLITTDTYRVAAVDQIREYSTLLGLDLRVAFSASEAQRAVDEFHTRDLVLIDTPGRNHRDRVAMASLRGMLENTGAVTALLLIPATLGLTQIEEIIDSYRELQPAGIVLTKTDETADLSAVTAIAGCCDWPITYVTTGQRVPQDIDAAERDALCDGLLASLTDRQADAAGGEPTSPPDENAITVQTL